MATPVQQARPNTAQPMQQARPAQPAPQQSAPQQAAPQQEAFPSAAIVLQAAKLAIEKDCAILLDYYRETASGSAFLGEDPTTGDRVLVKSKEEFTSLIQGKPIRMGEDLIILTQNSIYITSVKIQKRKVNLQQLQDYNSSYDE